MIVDFSVKNFRSIKEEQTFSMLAANLMDEHFENTVKLENESNLSLLKTALIYGANASGKSNLILAIEALRSFIIDSTDLKVGEEIPYYTPYKADKNCLNSPTKFEIEFVGNNNIRYKYTIVFNKHEIEVEELSFYPNRQETRLFLREKGKEIQFGSYLKGKKRSLESELISNNLFLSKAANSNHQQLQKVYLYFKRNLRFHTQADSRNTLLKYTTKGLANKEGNYRDNVIDFLKAADTGISAVDIVNKSIDAEDRLVLPDNMPETLKKQIIEDFSSRPTMYHKMYDGNQEIGMCTFDLDEESNGTIKMYDLAGKIINVLENGYTFIVDEIDSSFHPFMSDYLLELFNDPNKNPNNAQLIVATHDTTLMDSKTLRRDQVWFTEKNQYGATELYSLDEFEKNEVRKNIPFGKWYLSGRFGALPLINKSLFTIEKKEQ